MAIKYRAYNWVGKAVTGTLNVDSEATAYEMLARDQLLPYRLTPAKRRRSISSLLSFILKPPEQVLIDFTRQLGALLRAGISLHRALTALRDGATNPVLKDALTEVIEDLVSGQSLSKAFEKHSSIFPSLWIRLLRVGEATGDTPTVLDELVHVLERKKMVRERLKAALTYPAISLGVAFVAGFVLMTYSVPALVELLNEFGGELPTSTKLLLGVSELMGDRGEIIIGSPAIFIAGAVVFSRTQRGRLLIDSLMLRIPIIGQIVVFSSMFSFTSTFGAMSRGGVPTLQALQLVQESVGNRAFRRQIANASTAVESGQSFSAALKQQRDVPTLIVDGIATAELGGNLGQVLESLTDYYEKETTKRVVSATELIQPIVILMVAGLVGFVAISVVSGIYATLGSIK